MDFEGIPGVGEKTAAALAQLDDPETALKRGDVLRLASAPGITEGRAASIARAAIREQHGDPGTFLATNRARELYQDTLALLQQRTVTTYAKKRLETLFPSSKQSRIDEVRAFVDDATTRDPTPEVLEALTAVEPLAHPRNVRVRDRCLATMDAEIYAEAKEAVPELSVEIVEDARRLGDLARGYATVIALDEEFAGVDIDGDVQVKPKAFENPVDIVPERTLAFFAANRERLSAAIRVHRAADLEPPQGLELDALEAGLTRLNDDGTVKGDEELERLTAAANDLDAAVSMAENVANDRLREAIQARDVTIEGSDLLSLVEQGAGVDSLLSRELADEYDAAIEAARDHLVDSLSLDSGEAEIGRMIFGEEPTFPVGHQEQVVNRLREDLTVARDRRAARRKREVAVELDGMTEAVEELVFASLELDVELAIARFVADYDCVLPDLAGEGFDIEGGRSPLLDVPFDEVDPVDYAVEGVTLLSGVNSGGKTSTLDLCAVVVILAHMGLPVPAAKARISLVEELHYHAKTQGTLDAGAFESTLRDFAGLVTGDAKKLVLVDELESITEPGASAKIIAGILEALSERDDSGVFVSHLAGEIRDAADYAVAVDGIEAVGLVDGELVVNRSPQKDHLARSTPELIVEKLAAEGDATFYGRLLEKFEA
ncbi:MULTISPECIES: endonuclease MutS2 [unclassified Haladaptatus]|uniref:MutS-related protein n=1 Tax=unclassified Haladaptatus TaxID=2622732 RepID=UPI0023E80090|nr:MULTISPECIES: endonuclease MutS2 [unclassified Haladaptatus]